MASQGKKVAATAASKGEEWIARWIDAVAVSDVTMSQRKLSSITAHGGLEAVVAAAKAKGVHLVQLTDDKGAVLVAASREPFTALC